jgi:hypothetical protein
MLSALSLNQCHVTSLYYEDVPTMTASCATSVLGLLRNNLVADDDNIVA